MTPDEWHTTVGTVIARRRRGHYRSIRAAATAAGVSESIWRQLESGKRQLGPGHYIAPNPNAQTRHAVAAALAWDDDWLDRILAGEPPATVVPLGTATTRDQAGPATRMEPDLAARLDEVLAVLVEYGVRLDRLEGRGWRVAATDHGARDDVPAD